MPLGSVAILHVFGTDIPMNALQSEIVRSVIRSVIDLGDTMLMLDGIRVANVEIKPHQEPYEPYYGEVVAVVLIRGVLNGGVRLGGVLSSAAYLAGALLGSPDSITDQDLIDAFGEISNIVTGGIQTRLAKRGEINLYPPLVYVEDELSECYEDDYDAIRQDLTTPEGHDFFVEVFYRVGKD
jgi:CheY-specific phosphatase CheX